MDGVESIETAKDGILKLHLKGGKLVIINSVYMPPECSGAFLCLGSPIGPERAVEMAAALTHAAECTAAEKITLRLVARCEQSRRGLERKLALRGCRTEAAGAVLDRLEALDLINDQRYARLWLKSRLCSGSSPRTLGMLLAARGIHREAAEAALDEALTPETEDFLIETYLNKLTKKKSKKPCCMQCGRTRPLSPAEQKAAYKRLLKMEGFSAAAIARYFEE